MRTYNEEADELRKCGYLQGKHDHLLWHVSGYGGCVDEPVQTTLTEVGSTRSIRVSEERLVADYQQVPPYVLQLCKHPYATMKSFADRIGELAYDVRLMNERGVDPKLWKALEAVNKAMEEIREGLLNGGNR